MGIGSTADAEDCGKRSTLNVQVSMRNSGGISAGADLCRSFLALDSVSLQKAVNVLGQFRTDAFGTGDLLNGRLPQPVYRPELAQQQVFPVLTYARAIIQNALANPF